MIKSYPVSWFEKVIVKHDHVDGATAIDGREVRVVRKALDPITVVPVSSDFLVRQDLEELLVDHKPTLVVLVNSAGHYAWDARQLAEDQGASLQTFKELYTFLPDSDPRGGVDKGVSFVRSRLEQHSKVRAVSMICEATMCVSRVGTFDPLRIAVEQHYEFTEEALVHALKRHPKVNVVYNANPNGTVTQDAHSHAGHAGVEVLGLGDLLRRLHDA
ncbi:MAG: hypothetical protein ACR2MB_15945 [Acidimicrobiales bacterium]